MVRKRCHSQAESWLQTSNIFFLFFAENKLCCCGNVQKSLKSSTRLGFGTLFTEQGYQRNPAEHLSKSVNFTLQSFVKMYTLNEKKRKKRGYIYHLKANLHQNRL